MFRGRVNYSKKVKAFQIGEIVGEWFVLSYSGERGTGRNSYWRCRCSCGNESDVCGSSLRKGASTMCRKCSGRVNGRKGLNTQSKKHLYVARCGGFFKIGSSNNPQRRIKDLASSCPYPITVEAILLNRGHEESTWHEKYKDCHHHGEWFFGDCVL